MIRGQRSAYVRQEHDEDDEGELDDGGRVVYEQAFLKVLDERGFEDEVEVRRLEADEGTKEVQGLYAMLLLQEEIVECEEEDLQVLVKAIILREGTHLGHLAPKVDQDSFELMGHKLVLWPHGIFG